MDLPKRAEAPGVLALVASLALAVLAWVADAEEGRRRMCQASGGMCQGWVLRKPDT